MPYFFGTVFALVVLQRLIELWIARINSRRIAQVGGYEVGARHYKYFVMLHMGFLTGLAAEVSWRRSEQPVWWWVPFSLFVAAQGLRIWCMQSLGVHWNTRIFVVPDMNPVRRGPYRFLRHPNYMVVTLELLALPLTFGAYVTATIATIVNAVLLRHRIAVEETALSSAILRKEEAS